jgi:hypothetical protein
MINRGATFTLSNIRLSIGPDGVSEEPPTVTIAIDVTPFWLDIAVGHVRTAADAHRRVIAASLDEDNQVVSDAMELECKASMQGIVAAACALDAFYAAVKERVPIPELLSAQWRKNKTARYSQIGEVLRRSFKVGPKSTAELRSALNEVFSYRDQAVHPPAVARQPAYHPELNVSTEWRFVAFRSYNVLAATAAAISIVSQLAAMPKAKYPALSAYCDSASKGVQPILDQWQSEYAELLKSCSLRYAV